MEKMPVKKIEGVWYYEVHSYTDESKWEKLGGLGISKVNEQYK